MRCRIPAFPARQLSKQSSYPPRRGAGHHLARFCSGGTLGTPGGGGSPVTSARLSALLRDLVCTLQASGMAETLLSIAVRELGRALCCYGGLRADLALIPEDEIARGVWSNWQQCLHTAAAAGRPPATAAQHQVRLSVFKVFEPAPNFCCLHARLTKD